VGASLIHSASVAATSRRRGDRVERPAVLPVANEPWDARFPGVFTIHDGTMNTSILNGLGLGAV